MARVARELSEAKVWSRQLVQWMMRWRLSVALKQWQLLMTGADQVGQAGANRCAGKGEIAVFAEGLGLVFVRSGPQSPEQVCGGGAAVEGVLQVCGGGGAPGGAQQVCGGGGVPEGAQQMGGGAVPVGAQQLRG